MNGNPTSWALGLDFLLLCAFLGGILFRAVLYLVVRGEERFTLEFEKRVRRHLDGEYPETRGQGFSALVESLLKRTWNEAYVARAQHLRRTLDRFWAWADRYLGVESGAQRLADDTLIQARLVERGLDTPNLKDLTRFAFGANPYFNRLRGRWEMSVTHDLLNLLPTLLLVGGVLGTLLGVLRGLPALQGVDLGNLGAARAAMDGFLAQMTLSLHAAILGLGLSMAFSVVNTVLSPADPHARAVECFQQALQFLWNDASATAIDRAPERDPRTADLERHPEIRSHESTSGSGITPALPDEETPVAPLMGLPPPVPMPDEHLVAAQRTVPSEQTFRGPTPENLATAMAAAAEAEKSRGADAALLEEQSSQRTPPPFDPAEHEPPPYGPEDRTASFEFKRPPDSEDTDGSGFVPEHHEPPTYGDEHEEKHHEAEAAAAESEALLQAMSGVRPVPPHLETEAPPSSAPAPTQPAALTGPDSGVVEVAGWPVGGGDAAAAEPWPPAHSEEKEEDAA
ncbi:MAG TPA: hypothetical protein VL588_10370 [Bdellovibrionota bacterium]|jgi:hypothetical protein|nr:hypothetical protein [Bdellovibrionota bacterium]